VSEQSNCCVSSHCRQSPDEGLSRDQWESYERHLESCTTCQERLDHTQELGGDLQRLGREIGDPTAARPDPVLDKFLDGLRELESPLHVGPVDSVDLYFLDPTDRPGLLGTLGQYDVLEVIGQGGMGIVLKGYDPALKRLVAIKVLAAAVAGSAIVRRRFTREAQAAAAVCHDHVVAVHGVHQTDGLPYLVMQYVPGESLQDRLDREGPLEMTEVVRIGMQTAAGLAAAHAQGLIHRDVTPANLLLENGLAKVKITDFGLARMTDAVQLTENGVVAGTPEYMAPEQARGETVDHRSDLFSLGSVLYATCTGVPPFRGPSTLVVLRKVSAETPIPVRELNADVPAWLEQLISRLTCKDPMDRFQSAAEVAVLLESYLAHMRQPGRLPEPPLPLAAAVSGNGLRLARFVEKATKSSCLLVYMAAFLLLGTLLLVGTIRNHRRAADEQPLSLFFHQDFRSGTDLDAPFVTFGPDADSYCRAETGGYRITLPAGRRKSDPVGIVLPGPVQGDFEITTTYEIVHIDRPRGDFGVGFELYVMTATDTKEALGCYRLLRNQNGEVVACTRMTTENGKRAYKPRKFAPATSRSGRLRLTRKGTEATFSAADGPAEEFQEVGRYDLGSEDLKIVRLGAITGSTLAGSDVRILDLTVRAGSPAGADVQHSFNANAPPEGKKASWLAAAAVIGVVLAATVVGGLLVLVRLRRTGRGPSADEILPGRSRKPESADSCFSTSCPGCGKTLRGKAELAGKKVRCPNCGTTLVTRTGEHSG
jgi:serine/threonine protein kinase